MPVRGPRTQHLPLATRLRRLAGGLSTLFGVRPRGFYIPMRGADDVSRIVYPGLETTLRRREDDMFKMAIARIDRYAAAMTAIGSSPPPAPRFNQDWFPRLDAALAYSFVRDFMPRRIVEIGSGHSTRFMAQAIRDESLPTRLISIDPAPRAVLDGLKIERIAAPVQGVGAEVFAQLDGGDMLFIDSSHVLMPGTDVDFLINMVLPVMPAGLLVHFHDIFLPDPYPADWEWRGYNEQNAVAALVQSPGYEVLAASHYMATRMKAAIDASSLAAIKLPRGAVEGSLWLRKLSPPISAAI